MAERSGAGRQESPTAGSPTAGSVWALLNELVRDSRREWTRIVSAETGMAYSRVRALRVLADGDRTMSELAREVVVDSSAATGILNDLEERGLAERRSAPESRRVRIASITEAGRELVATVGAVEIPRPAGVDALGADDLAALDRILRAIAAADDEQGLPD